MRVRAGALCGWAGALHGSAGALHGRAGALQRGGGHPVPYMEGLMPCMGGLVLSIGSTISITIISYQLS